MKDLIDDNTEKAIEQFKKYPILGCTTVLDMARVASGYDPNGDMNDANKEKISKLCKSCSEMSIFSLGNE